MKYLFLATYLAGNPIPQMLVNAEHMTLDQCKEAAIYRLALIERHGIPAKITCEFRQPDDPIFIKQPEFKLELKP